MSVGRKLALTPTLCPSNGRNDVALSVILRSLCDAAFGFIRVSEQLGEFAVVDLAGAELGNFADNLDFARDAQVASVPWP